MVANQAPLDLQDNDEAPCQALTFAPVLPLPKQASNLHTSHARFSILRHSSSPMAVVLHLLFLFRGSDLVHSQACLRPHDVVLVGTEFCS
jgi:hypothetical protein